MKHQPLLSPRLEAWRQRYSPLRTIEVDRVVSLMEAGTDRGEYAELQWLIHHVLKRWPVLRALRERRAAALLRLEWSVRVVADLPPGSTPAQARAQSDALRAAYDRVDNLREALRFLSLAEFTGYTHLQKHRGADGGIDHLEPLDPWNWVRDGNRGAWYWNPAAETIGAQVLKSRPDARIDVGEFVIREVENPIYEAALPLYLYHNLALRDWISHLEMYGIPRPVLIMPEGFNSEEQLEEFQRAADRLGDGGGGCLPHGTVAAFPAASHASAPFKEVLEEIETRLVMAATGGQLAMLNQPAGLGSNTARAHQDAFNEIAEAEAMEITELFQRQFDRDVLERRFPGQPPLAFFSLAPRQETNVTEVVRHVADLAAAGYRVAAAQVSEITGYTMGATEPDPSARVSTKNSD